MASRSRNVRPLLPAPQSNALPPGPDSRLQMFDQSDILPARKRGKQVDLACDACKKRKSKCDGRRPHCMACDRKSTTCFYDEESREANKVAGLKRQNHVLEEELFEAQTLLAHLRQCSESEAQAVLVSLRNGKEIRDIINISPPASRGSDALWQAQIGSGRLHDGGYKSEEPDNDDFVPLDRMPSKFDVYRVARQAGLVESTTPSSQLGVDRITFTFDVLPSTNTSPFMQKLPQVRSTGRIPRSGTVMATSSPRSHQTPFVDLRAHPWTKSTDNDEFFSHLICLWLSHHAHCLPYVYPTLFLEGMRGEEENDHCSRMLVNAILAIACQYSPDSSDAGPPDQPGLRGHKFYLEAYSYWEESMGRPCLTTLQALIAMYEFNKLRGKDRFGWVLLHSAVEMGFDIGLFTYPGADSGMADDLKFARNFTAWSIYNYQAVESVIFCKLPRLQRCRAIKPIGPLIASGLTEKWRPFNISEGVTRDSFFWDHWRAFCSLSDILIDAACMLFADEADGIQTPEGMMTSQAADLMVRTMMWHAELPPSLSLDRNEMPQNLWLHMNYYMLVIALHRPLLPHPGPTIEKDPSLNESVRHNMFNASQNIVRLATIALEHFGYNYRTAYDSQVCAAAAFTLVHDVHNEASRHFLLESVAILHTQASRFLFSGALARSVLLAAQELAQTDPDAQEILNAALEENMTFDYLALDEGSPSSGKRPQQTDASLARFVTSRFPSKISSSFDGTGYAVASGGRKLDEVLSAFYSLDLSRD